MSNKNLHLANVKKNDEFYTQLTDIESEVYKYKDQLENKIIYCNCDDPAWSNFVRYFLQQFNNFKLKGLIATGYIRGAGSLTNDIDLFNCQDVKYSYKLEFKEVDQELINTIASSINNNISNEDLYKFLNKKKIITELKGDGDFRSNESIKLLLDCDVVITNPPFSLFRDYIEQLMMYDKKFLIIGNKNAITYKEVFKHIMNNKLWLGYGSPNEFGIPDGTISKQITGLTRWYTNLDVSKRKQNIILCKHYNPEDYPKYDNYNAIEVSKVVDIPCDYDGVMGVPITFLDKYNPEQFEILGDSRYHDNQDFTEDINIVKGKLLYRRILIKKLSR